MEIKPGTEITTGNVMPGYTMAQIVEYFPPTFDEPAGYTVIYPNASTGFITAATVERHNRV